MADPFGFIKYPRVDNAHRPTLSRIRDFEALEVDLDEATRREQAARCMNCGIPHCHHGIFYGPGKAVGGCPNDNLIPEWQDLVYRNEDRLAFDRLTLTNPLPDFTGLVCPAPCELSCNEALHGQGITIRNNEHFIIEQAFKNGWVQAAGTPAKRYNYKVAVIGSGPAGLAAAWRLNQLGYRVTVFEKADRPGGLCMYGIPNMKLPKAVLLRRIEVMKAVGITFELNTEVGVDVTKETLERQFDRLIVCIGAQTPRDLNLENRTLAGIEFAVPFLTEATQSVLAHGTKATNALAGKNVLVVGGGDTGNDCVATAIRQGAKSVKQLEITPQAPENRLDNNPWPGYPMVRTTDYGQEEAAAAFETPLTDYEKTITGFHGSNGQLTHVTIQKVKQFQPIPGTQEDYPVDLVLLAMGFTGPQEAILKALGVTEIHDNYQTNDEQIYAAGDAKRGPSLVIWAIREGRLAADKTAESLQKIQRRQLI